MGIIMMGEVFTGFVLYLRRWARQEISIDFVLCLGEWDFGFFFIFWFIWVAF
jgi:hypothetical protein